MKPLEGLIVLDFSQFLSGPSAALRLADLGARVIKIERPEVGDPCRQLSLKQLKANGSSVLFHTINRNKEGYAADLKQTEQLERVKRLIGEADVLIENFRPGTMEKLGLGVDEMRKLNPKLVYGRITGYGKEGPWKDKPGQDLLVQSLSGAAWLNGESDQPPMPFGLAVADMFAGAHLAQGILACLVRRGRTGQGGLVEVSLLESMLDFQFEVLTTYLNDGGMPPKRSAANHAHAYLGAPYGIYETNDGYIALAMGSVVKLGELIGCRELTAYTDPNVWFDLRDEIKSVVADHLKTCTTSHWLSILEHADYWCADVLTWEKLTAHDAFRRLEMTQTVNIPGVDHFETTRCPIRINGQMLTSAKGAPTVGEDNAKLDNEFDLKTGKETA